MDIVRFVRNIREQWTLLDKDTTLHIVFGNESFDLDSFVSSLIWAYILECEFDRIKSGGNNSDYFAEPLPKKCAIIPVVPLSREDIELRGDIVFLMRSLGLDLDSLIYLYEDGVMESMKLIAKENRLKASITDHNTVHLDLKWTTPFMVHIVDHHTILEELPDGLIFKDIRTIASTTTIISEFVLQFIKQHEQSKFVFNESLFKVLLSAMMVDNHSGVIKEVSYVTTERDIIVFDMLLTYAQENLKSNLNLEKERINLRKDLLLAKNDVSQLTTPQMMKKDYKEWIVESPLNETIKYGISSMPISVNQWRLKDKQLFHSVVQFAQKQNLDLYIANLSYNKKKVIFFAKDQRMLENLEAAVNLFDAMKKRKASTKQIERVDPYSIFSIKVKKTSNRKLLQPFVHKVLEEYVTKRSTL